MLATIARVILKALVVISGSKLGQIQYILYKVSHRIFRIIQCIVRRNWGLTHLRCNMKPRPDPDAIIHDMILDKDNQQVQLLVMDARIVEPR